MTRRSRSGFSDRGNYAEGGTDSSGVKPQAHISNLYYDPGTDGIGTVTIMISYGDAEAQATILVTQPTDDNVLNQIRSLGEALQQAARSPQSLFSYPKIPLPITRMTR